MNIRVIAVAGLICLCPMVLSQPDEPLGVAARVDPESIAQVDVSVGTAPDPESDADQQLNEETEKTAIPKLGRPGEEEGPTEIKFFVYIIDIDDIDGAAQNFATNVFITLEWRDENLALGRDTVWNVPLQQIWNPRIMITNKQGIVRKSFPEIAEVQPNGTVIYRQRYVGRMSQPLHLSEFPFDRHTFTITFIAVGFTPRELKFVPGLTLASEEVTGAGMYKQLSVPDWEIIEYKAEARPFEPIEGMEIAGFAFDFIAKRETIYYVWQVIVPLVLIVMMSWGGFWIDPGNAGTRIGVATSSMLTLIAYRFMLSGLTPRLSYMTRLDYFTLGSTILVFLTLVQVVVASLYTRHESETIVRRMDLCARFAFPVIFAAWTVWTLVL